MKRHTSSNLLAAEHDSINLSFDFDLLNGVLNLSPALAQHLNCPNRRLIFSTFMMMIPKSDYHSVYRIHQLIGDYFKHQKKLRFHTQFILVHSIKTERSEPYRLLREIRLKPTSETNRTLICENKCIDVSNLHFEQGVFFDLNLPKAYQRRKAYLMRPFKAVLPQYQNVLSERELEVLRVWKEVDSAALAAKQLGISVRTLHTHLANMRKRLNVRRSMDIITHVKKNGWL